jgi:hypothetical protein
MTRRARSRHIPPDPDGVKSLAVDLETGISLAPFRLAGRG